MTAALEGQPEADELAELLRPEVADSLVHGHLHSVNALQAGGA